MQRTVVDQLYDEFVAIVQALGQTEVSLRNTAEEVFRKALLLAAASHFEKRVVEIVKASVHVGANGDELVCELVARKALERQYHTLFDWEGQNANKFFRLFGDGFSGYMKKEVVQKGGIEDAIHAFLQVGNDRNRLVHRDFGSFSSEKTAKEIYEAYGRGIQFVDELENCFTRYRKRVSEARADTAESTCSNADI